MSMRHGQHLGGPRVRPRSLPQKPTTMGKIVRCRDCGKVYREVEELEDLRDHDSNCLVCNSPIEVADWDRVLASYEDDDEEEASVDEDDWDDDEHDDEDDLEEDEHDDDGLGEGFEALEEEDDDEDDEEDEM